MLFLGDPVDAVIKEHQIQQDFSVEEETMAVVVTPTDVKVVLEGIGAAEMRGNEWPHGFSRLASVSINHRYGQPSGPS
uniref:Uncharacterized protein n=1 Tax=Knipowitschia caucasica TaxID=637954 RepID=A0AAV2KB25_KNICA